MEQTGQRVQKSTDQPHKVLMKVVASLGVTIIVVGFFLMIMGNLDQNVAVVLFILVSLSMFLTAGIVNKQNNKLNR